MKLCTNGDRQTFLILRTFYNGILFDVGMRLYFRIATVTETLEISLWTVCFLKLFLDIVGSLSYIYCSNFFSFIVKLLLHAFGMRNDTASVQV